MHTLASLGGRVAAVGADGLLDVERPLACENENEVLSAIVLIEN